MIYNFYCYVMNGALHISDEHLKIASSVRVYLDLQKCFTEVLNAHIKCLK